MDADRWLAGGLAAGFIVALAAHLTLGWAWSCTGGVVTGLLVARRQWLGGVIVLTTSWTVLVLFNLIVAPGPVLEMHRVVGQIFAQGPGWLVPVATILSASILGLISGLLGGRLRAILHYYSRRKLRQGQRVHG
jgi:hypothetical protein